MGRRISEEICDCTTKSLGQMAAYAQEYCYNTTYHMSIKMTPFMELYGYEAPSFMDLVLGDSRVTQNNILAG